MMKNIHPPKAPPARPTPAKVIEEHKCCKPVSEKRNQNTNSAKQNNDELMLAAALALTPPVSTLQRRCAQTYKTHLMTMPPPLARSEKHIALHLHLRGKVLERGR
jgi:predicted anti-sigma-YlaC factor YlaD